VPAGTPLTITDAYASAISDIGVRVQGSKAATAISTGVATASETARANDSGVNLDEEAARLIQFSAELPGRGQDPAGRAGPCSTRCCKRPAR